MKKFFSDIFYLTFCPRRTNRISLLIRFPFWLVLILITLQANVVSELLFGKSTQIVYICGSLLIAVSMLCAITSRLHDCNKSAWYIIFACIPLLSRFFFMWLFLYPGTVGPNTYGEEPKPGLNIRNIPHQYKLKEPKYNEKNN